MVRVKGAGRAFLFLPRTARAVFPRPSRRSTSQDGGDIPAWGFNSGERRLFWNLGGGFCRTEAAPDDWPDAFTAMAGASTRYRHRFVWRTNPPRPCPRQSNFPRPRRDGPCLRGRLPAPPKKFFWVHLWEKRGGANVFPGFNGHTLGQMQAALAKDRPRASRATLPRWGDLRQQRVLRWPISRPPFWSANWGNPQLPAPSQPEPWHKNSRSISSAFCVCVHKRFERFHRHRRASKAWRFLPTIWLALAAGT